jgi:siderophore synthetase component
MTIPSLAYLERFRNEGTRTYSNHSDYSEAEQIYQPASATSTFSLPVFTVPRQHLNIYTANPAADLASRYLSDEHALFCVHPQVLAAFHDDRYLQMITRVGQSGPEVVVEPSSSTRTLLARDRIPHALKVHFPFRISRYGRKMRDEVIAQAIAVSLEIERGIDHFDETFCFLPEVIGVACKNQDSSGGRGENWGYLVRDMRALPAAKAQKYLVPGFALYGRDFLDPARSLLLWDLIGSGKPLDFVLDNLMLPIIRHWVQCYQSFGFMLEPHGQNVLLELDDQLRVTRIVHRDLSVGIDMRRRQHYGLTSEHLNSYNRMTSGEFLSITYDMFMGSHFFDRIVACCLQRYPDLCEDDFRKPCRDYFTALFPDHRDWMPVNVYYFSEVRDRYGKPGYQNTGRTPVWRP